MAIKFYFKMDYDIYRQVITRPCGRKKSDYQKVTHFNNTDKQRSDQADINAFLATEYCERVCFYMKVLL